MSCNQVWCSNFTGKPNAREVADTKQLSLTYIDRHRKHSGTYGRQIWAEVAVIPVRPQVLIV